MWISYTAAKLVPMMRGLSDWRSMRKVPRLRTVLLVAALALCVGQAFGASFSFTGVFSTDDQLQQFNFKLSSPATVTLRTWSYAGGTNQAGMVIPRGGFDPWLTPLHRSGGPGAVGG
jgi:hypothetical protein